MLIGAGADEAQRTTVLPGPLAHQPADLHLAQCGGDAFEALDAQLRRNLVEQRLDRGRADRREHLADVGLGVRYERHGQPPSAASSVW